MTFEEALTELDQSRSSMRCSDLKRLLTKLGFEVKDGKNGGHKVFTHGHLPTFISGSFDCGHGKDPEIKPAYIGKIIRTLKQHEDDLQKFLKMPKKPV